MPGNQQAKKCHKMGRNKSKGETYRARGRRLKNKLRKLRKHIKAQPFDSDAKDALKHTLNSEAA